MTNKERTIKAIEILMEERYNNKKCNFLYCPLCTIYRGDENCIGCPNQIFEKLRNNDKYFACVHSFTLDLWIKIGIWGYRRKFWQEALPIIKELPNKAFTVKGYKDEYFEPLLEIDRKLADKYKLCANKS